MLFDTDLINDNNTKTNAASAPLPGKSLPSVDQLLLQDNPDTGSEVGRAWPSSISAQSDYSLFSENKFLLNQD